MCVVDEDLVQKWDRGGVKRNGCVAHGIDGRHQVTRDERSSGALITGTPRWSISNVRITPVAEVIAWEGTGSRTWPEAGVCHDPFYVGTESNQREEGTSRQGSWARAPG